MSKKRISAVDRILLPNEHADSPPISNKRKIQVETQSITPQKDLESKPKAKEIPLPLEYTFRPNNFTNWRKDKVVQLRAMLILLCVCLTTVTVSVIALVSKSAPNGDQTSQPPALSNILLPAPVRPVDAGASLSQIEIRDMLWPSANLPDGAIQDRAELEGLFAREQLPAGQPILRSQVASKKPATGIADLIPSGFRAITLEVNATAGVEGWANPGALVDVVVTYLDPNDNKKKTQVVVEKSIVLSFNGQTTPQTTATGQDSKRLSQNATVTLATPARSALKIQTAQAMGKINLILRNSDDFSMAESSIVSMDEFMAPLPAKKAPAPPPIAAAPPKERVVGTAKFMSPDGTMKELKLLNDGWTDSLKD